MPDPVTGTLAATTVVSGISADRASERADKTNRKSLRFDIQKYDDWKKIYGPIEENLSEYFQTLSPESLTVQGLEDVQVEFQRVETAIKENLAQRGLEDSGIEEATSQNLQIQKAIAKSKVRQEAPEAVARQQQQFLQGGEQRRARAEQGISQSLHNQGIRADVDADRAAEAFGNMLNIGIQQAIPELNTNSNTNSAGVSTATASTLRK